MPGHSTLLTIAVFTPALTGCLLLLSWLQHRKVTALALWGAGFINASVATTLIIVLRGTIATSGRSSSATYFWLPLTESCGVARGNWTAKTSQSRWQWWGGIMAGSLLGWPHLRPAGSPGQCMVAIGIAYTLLAALELWRGRGDDVWRWPIIALLLAHAIAIPIHIPLAGTWAILILPTSIC